MGMTTSWSPLITLCCSNFLWKFIYFWRHFNMFQFSMGSFYWFMSRLLHVFVNLHVCFFIFVFGLWPSGRDIRMFRWLTFQITIFLLNAWIIIFNLCLMYDLLAMIYKCFVFRVFGPLCLGKWTYWLIIIEVRDIIT